MAKKKASAKKVQTQKKSTQTSKAAPKKVAKSVGKKVKTKVPAKKSAKKVTKKAVKKAATKAKPQKAFVKTTKATSKKGSLTKKSSSKSPSSAKNKKTVVASKVAKKTAVKSKKVVPSPKAKVATSVVMQKYTAPTKVAVPDFKSLIGKLQPLDDRVLIALNEMEKMTAGGLYIPATVSDVSGNVKGTVVAVGRGHQNKKGHVKNMDVQVGDQVIFSEYAGSKVKLEGSELVMLRETEILGIVSK